MRSNQSIRSSVLFLALAALVGQLALVSRSGVVEGPDPSFEPAAWVGRNGGAVKIAADGTPRLEVADGLQARAVAVDQLLGRTWLFGDQTLRAVDFDGQPILSATLSGITGATPRLAAHGGALWLGSQDVLYRLDDGGLPVATLPLASTLRDLALDTASGELRAATRTAVFTFDSSGVQVAVLPLDDPAGAQAIAVDDATGGFWVALARSLRRYDPAGVLELEIELRGVEHLASDGSGGIWAATSQDLLHLDGDGAVLAALEPVGVPGNAVALAADAADASAWLATQQHLVRVASDGQILFDVELQSGNGPPGTTFDLAVYSDLTAPQLAFVSPRDGARVDDPRTPLELAWSDAGEGVDDTSLVITLGGAPLAVSCDLSPSGASCTPADDLPPGQLTLLATVADFAGNVSAPAQVTFEVVPPNRPPVLTPIGDRTVELGSPLILTVAAVDPDGDTLLFSASPLPLPGDARLDGVSGGFTFHPSEDEVGEFTITFSVSDGLETVSETVSVTVTAPPPGAPTSIAGRLLDTNDFVLGVETPIVGATVSIAGAATLSAADGSFLISGIAGGGQVIFIDSTTAFAAPDGTPYASFAEAIHLIDGAANVVERPFFLPRIDPSSLTPVDPAATTMVTNPGLGVTVTVPPATARLPDGSSFTGELSVSEVPAALAPVNLPEELAPALLLTVQPVGVTFATPVAVTTPNLDGMPPGSELDLWSVNPVTGLFEIVGVGRVSDDGTVIETVSGGIRAASWHAFLGPLLDFFGGDNNGDNRDQDRCDDCSAGSRTALSSGNLTISHDLPAYFSLDRARSLRLVYNSEHASPRPTVSSRITISRRAAVPQTVSAGIEVGGVDFGPQVFTDTSGLNENVDEELRQIVRVDASGLTTGSYAYRMRLTSNYPSSAVSSFQSGRILVHNLSGSPIGAGWSIARLQRLHVQADRSVVLSDGDGSILRFEPTLTADNGLEARFFDTNNPVGAVGNGFAGLTPGTFRVTTADSSFLTDSTTLPVIDFPDTGFDVGAFYNVGPNGVIDPGSGINTPQGDDVSIQPPGGNDNFGAQFRGFLFLPGGGDVTFTVGVDDAFDLIVAGQSVARFLGVTDFRNVSGTATGLPAGFVPITLNYGEAGGEAGVVLRGSGGGLPGGVIPPTFLFLAPAGGGLPDEFVSPAGDFSTLRRNPDGSFTRSFRDGSAHHFDAAGMQTAAEDPNGNATTYSYDAAGRLTAVTDPVGRTTALAYSGGRLATVTDPTGRVASFDHDAAGNLTRIVDADGTARELDYDANHRLTRQRSKRGFTVDYGYNFAGHNVSVVRADGSLRSIFPKDAVGLVDPARPIGKSKSTAVPVVRPADAIAQYIDGNGNLTIYDTDRFGASVKTVDAFGRQTTATRDDDGNPLQIVSPTGSTRELSYDDHGNLLSLRQFGGAGEGSQEIRFDYDPDLDRVTQITDPRGNALTLAYDAGGNPVRITDPLGGDSTAVYNSRGQVVSTTDANGHTVSFTYDANGNTRTITDAAGVVTRFTRDAAGNVLAITEAEGLPEERTTSYTYDALNRPLTVTAPDGAVTRTTYDASGNGVETRSATGEVVRREFDAMNRAVQIADPIAGTTRLAYDGNGNVVEMVDSRGSRTTFEYDANNRMVRSLDALGGEQRFTYDGRGNMLSFANAEGHSATLVYDTLDRLVRQTDPLGNSTLFSYDDRNFLASTTDAEGRVVTYDYDALGRVVAVTTPDNLIHSTYDAVGNLLAIADGDSRVEIAYDAVDRPATITVVDVGVQPGVTLTASYDALGNRTGLGDSAGGATAYAYDVLGRRTRVTPPSGGAIDLSYDAVGRLLGVAFPNGLSMDYDYDAGGRLAGLQYRDSGGAALHSFSYLYDAVGNLLSIAEGARVREYSYDALQRLVSGGSAGLPETYDYDAAGNRISSFLSATSSYDGGNRLLEDDTYTYAYDAIGNLTAKTEKAGGATTGYSYDAQNQLVRIDFPDGTSASYRYDGLGRRIEKDVDGEVTRYVYDGTEILLEYDGSDALRARYTHGPWTDLHLAMQRDGASYYYLSDHQSSARFLTDAAGNQVNSYDYDSFGRVLVRQQTVADPYGYSGRELDEESGLYYLRARYYDPESGRFVSQDPLGLGGGDPNFYSYVSNNPVNATDPSGLFGPWDLLDVLSFGLSLKDFIECPSLENGLWLALDTISLLPIIPSLGLIKRGAGALDAASDIARAANRVDDAVDAARAADNFGDVGSALHRAAANCTCLTADTEIRTRDGDQRVDEIHVGDEVWAKSDATGELGLRPVLGVFERDVEELLRVEVAGEVLETTAQHPLWVIGRGWLEAGELEVGDRLLDRAGDELAVTGVERRQGRFTVYNFEVEGFGSYFASELELWLHNCALNPRIRTGVGDRLESAFAKIEPQHLGTGTGTNSASRNLARNLGNQADDAGHAIGRNLGGSGGATGGNIFPQAPSVNRGAFRQFERQVADAVRNGDEVFARVVPRYNGNSTRPFEILYQARINGTTITRVFPNP